MGLFKKIGQKIKRVVSLKNVINTVSGNFGAVAKDAVRIATTEKPTKEAPVINQVVSPTPVVIPQTILDIADAQGAKFSQNLTSKIAKTDTAQDASSFLAKIGMQSLYEKYKTWITVGALALLAFILWRVFGHKKGTARSRARR
ncbi:hypothetical protein CLU81_5322 [Flavobacterium sp. 9]|uniref:hypothetical protein n=1 Tax=Flavobacterium sp. 9 TaxID=2035198 RepID=UPI000C1A39F8|nr:hypothetical protein [Flavobacterium sp. 9]PIF34661.1 hypothetical protein CLU81_5322 [Flavobacterium sp. 9]